MTTPRRNPGSTWGRRTLIIVIVIGLVGAAAVVTAIAVHHRAPSNASPSQTAPVASSQPPAPTITPASPSPSPSASPVETPRVNCAIQLAACGYPDASSTGVYGQLSQFVGNFSTTKDGQVVANLDITGQLNVVNNDVIVYDVRAASIVDTGSGGTFTYISTHASSSVGYAAGFTDATVRYANIAGGQDNVRTFGAVTITDSYLHDMAATDSSHDDNIQVLSGTSLTVTHSTLQAYSASSGERNNSSLQIGEQSGDIGPITFTDDWLDGGNYTLSANWGSTDKVDTRWPVGSPFRGPHTIGALTFTGNRFGSDAHYGLVSEAFMHPPNSALTWVRNVSDTGSTLP